MIPYAQETRRTGKPLRTLKCIRAATPRRASPDKAAPTGILRAAPSALQVERDQGMKSLEIHRSLQTLFHFAQRPSR